MTEKEAKVYSLSTCSHCKAAKKFLSECDVIVANRWTDSLKQIAERVVTRDLFEDN